MTALLTSISGQFGRMVTLGTLFPVLIVLILNELMVAPLFSFGPALQEQMRRIAVGEDKWAAVSLLFILTVITGLLYNFNIPILRIYESYPWKDSLFGRFLTRPKLKRLRQGAPLRLAMRYLNRDLEALNAGPGLSASLQDRQTEVARYLNSELPDQEELVLPTRLGNVIRCFEGYSFLAYGMDAIVLWPRLVSKIDDKFASTIDDAKASLDFMVNLSFLCAISASVVVLAGIFTRDPMVGISRWLWRAVFFIVLSILFYAFSIGRAKTWGEQVKSAFDLFRFDLLSKLGYQGQPQTYFEEQALWRRISNQLLYADSRENPVPYKAATRVSAAPLGVRLAINRKLTATGVSGTTNVEITLDNTDTMAVGLVLLSETVPEGFRFVPSSAAASAGALSVTSLTPLEMLLDGVPPKSVVKVTYSLRANS